MNISIQPLGGSWKREKILIVIGIALFYQCYLLLTFWTLSATPIDVSLSWDHQWPLHAPWILAYGMVYMSAILPLFVLKDPLLFRYLGFAYLTVECISMICFVIFPVHMFIRPEFTSIAPNTFFDWGIRLCYWVDHPTCCFPSLHVSMSFIAALCCSKVSRIVGGATILIAVLISLSTLFVKQHFIADVFGGLFLAGGSYLYWMRTAPTLYDQPKERVYALKYAFIPCLIYIGIILTLYSLYWSGWVPN